MANTFPYLTYEHPLAKKLLRQKINRYNRRAKQWGYATRINYNLKGFAIPDKYVKYKYDADGGFWKNFKNGYRNKYLDGLSSQIILESTDLRVKMSLVKRIRLFIIFWINYP